MTVPFAPPSIEAISGVAEHLQDLESRLLATGIGCFNASDLAMRDICLSTGMSDESYRKAKIAKTYARLASLDSINDPLQEAMTQYESGLHEGAARERIRAAFDQQLAADCTRTNWVQPHSKEGIKSTVLAAASAVGIATGKRAFGNYKPVLIAQVTSGLSLVGTLYWPGESPLSPNAGLDWQFYLFHGDAEQAAIAKVLNPPEAFRLTGLGGVLVGQNYMLRHENTQQVYVFTQATSVLMLWFAEKFCGAS